MTRVRFPANAACPTFAKVLTQDAPTRALRGAAEIGPRLYKAGKIGKLETFSGSGHREEKRQGQVSRPRSRIVMAVEAAEARGQVTAQRQGQGQGQERSENASLLRP